MKVTRTDARLFDPDRVRAPAPIVVFLAVPSQTPDRMLWIEAMRRACLQTGARRGVALAVLTGEDLNSTDPALVADRQRETFTTEVDALLAVHGPSWGSSREYALAGELLIPRHLAVPEDTTCSAARGADGVGLTSEGRFETVKELELVLKEWLERYVDDIRARHQRRVAPRGLAENVRKPALRSWKSRRPPEQRRIAKLIGMTVMQIERLLMTETRFAEAHIEIALTLASELGVWSGDATLSDPTAQTAEALDHREFRAFKQAAAFLELDDVGATRLLNAGIAEKQTLTELHMAGTATRRSLRARNGWLTLWRER